MPRLRCRKLDADAGYHAGEQAAVGAQEGIVDFVAAADVEVEMIFIPGNVDQNTQKALSASIEGDRYGVALLDQFAQLKNDFATFSERATFDFFVGIGVVHNVLPRFLACLLDFASILTVFGLERYSEPFDHCMYRLDLHAIPGVIVNPRITPPVPAAFRVVYPFQ